MSSSLIAQWSKNIISFPADDLSRNMVSHRYAHNWTTVSFNESQHGSFPVMWIMLVKHFGLFLCTKLRYCKVVWYVPYTHGAKTYFFYNFYFSSLWDCDNTTLGRIIILRSNMFKLIILSALLKTGSKSVFKVYKCKIIMQSHVKIHVVLS